MKLSLALLAAFIFGALYSATWYVGQFSDTRNSFVQHDEPNLYSPNICKTWTREILKDCMPLEQYIKEVVKGDTKEVDSYNKDMKEFYPLICGPEDSDCVDTLESDRERLRYEEIFNRGDTKSEYGLIRTRDNDRWVFDEKYGVLLVPAGTGANSPFQNGE